MKFSMIVQDLKTGSIYDISQLVTDLSIETSIGDQPGKLTFNYIDDGKARIREGSPVSLKVKGHKTFFGYVFKRSLSNDEKVGVTAYDQLRYLKFKDTKVISGVTASQFFESVCKERKMKYKVIDKSSYVMATKTQDNKSLYEMMDYGITQTMIAKTKWYMVRDNFGTLEFANVNSYKTDLVLGDKSLLTDYNFESSIDDDTYNQIKLIKELKDEKKRKIYVVKDSNTIKRWGVLQYFEKVDENMTAAQIKDRAEMLLKLKNRLTKTLKISCIGDITLFAGCGVVLVIKALEREGIDVKKYFMVTSCTHNISHDSHTMSLELQVSV